MKKTNRMLLADDHDVATHQVSVAVSSSIKLSDMSDTSDIRDTFRHLKRIQTLQ
jgi:hypothetical protein